MKIYPVLLAVLLATVAIPPAVMAAVTTTNSGPETIKIKMGEIYLPFQHWKHQNMQNSKCADCHRGKEWKIDVWGRAFAHLICISCHERVKNGPKNCKECHKTVSTPLQKDLQ